LNRWQKQRLQQFQNRSRLYVHRAGDLIAHPDRGAGAELKSTSCIAFATQQDLRAKILDLLFARLFLNANVLRSFGCGH